MDFFWYLFKYPQMLNIIALATVFILVIYFNDRIRSEIWAFVLAFRRVLCPFFKFLIFLLIFLYDGMLLQIVVHLDYGLSGRLLRTTTPKVQVTLINGHALLFVLISPCT